MTVYITEYAESGTIGGQGTPVGREPAITTQTRTTSGASAQSSAFNSATRLVRVHTDAICSVLIGVNPTATTSSPRLAANQTEYFQVTPGHVLAAITNT